MLAVHSSEGAWNMNFLLNVDASTSSNKQKSDDENKSNEQQSFVTQTVPNWPKYLVVKSTDETVCK